MFQKWNIKLNRRESMINKPRFEGAIRSKGTTEGRLAKEMGMSANTFSTKKNKGTFNIAEVEWLCRRLEIVKPEDKCDIFLVEKFQ